MERVTDERYAEVLGLALDYFPSRIRELAGADVFCGDPIFAGVHDFEVALDGRSYRRTPHACYPFHVADKRTTIVLPSLPSWETVVHEFGHALDWALHERSGEEGPVFAPVSGYARRNRQEAFAEAFTAWFYPAENEWFAYDEESRAFFDQLAA